MSMISILHNVYPQTTANGRVYSQKLWDTILKTHADPIMRYFPVKEIHFSSWEMEVFDTEGHSMHRMTGGGLLLGNLVSLSGVCGVETGSLSLENTISRIGIRRQVRAITDRFFPLKDREV